MELSTGQFQAADVALGGSPTNWAAWRRPSACVAESDRSEAALSRARTSNARRRHGAHAPARLDLRQRTAMPPCSEHFSVNTLAGFGFDDEQPCLAAAGALLLYVQETLKASLGTPQPAAAVSAGSLPLSR